MRNERRNRVELLYRLAPVIGITLPAEVLAARDKEKKLEQALADASASVAEIPTDGMLMQELLEAGEPTREYEQRVLEAHSRRDLLETEINHLRWALETAAEATVTTIARLADDIIVDLLQPALDRIVATVRKHGDAGRLVPWDDYDRAMRNEDKAVRDAYVAIDREATRYAALREAQELLWFRSDQDTRRGGINNLPEIWPGYSQSLGPAVRAPWDGMTAPQALYWQVANGAELWCPTLDQIEDLSRAEREASGLKARAHGFGTSPFGGL